MHMSDSPKPANARFNYFMAGFLVAIAAVIVHGTFFVSRSKGDISMPLVFPSALIALLLILAISLVVRTYLNALPAPEGEPLSLAGHAKAALIFAITVGYPLAMLVVGFPLATALALIAFSLALGERRYGLVLLYAFSFAAFVYGVFVMMLRVPLPMGFFA